MTDNQAFEVEMKFRLPSDRSGFLDRLASLGAIETETVQQADRYFNHPSRDFAETDEALRIRSIGDRNVLTYKGPKIGTRTKTRREIEPALGAGAATAEQFAEILELLSFRLVAIVRKTRRCFSLVRGERRFEIAVDEVEDVGAFVEIETTADRTTLDAAQDGVVALAAELELSDHERHSYLSLLLRR